MDVSNPRVKISDIAKRAGVSSGTVDRVIHNRGEVAIKTREKVLKIIREMNYEPDILASTLASKKNYRFASLIPEGDEANLFWKSPAEGLEQALNEIKHFGIALDKHFFPYFDRSTFQKELLSIAESKPSGVVIAPVFSRQTIEILPKFSQMGIPVVFLNTKIENQNNIAFVGQEPGKSGMLGAKLLEYGLVDKSEIFIINIISQLGGNSHILNREEGFKSYFSSKENPTTHTLKTIDVNILEPENLDYVLKKHLGDTKPGCRNKGIFVTNSKVFHIAQWLEKNNLSFIKLVGYDLLEQNQYYLKRGTIDFLISQQPREQGYKSIMTLFNHLLMKKQIIKDQFLPIDIITKENIDFYINH
jgi:LacI family transcriptional regulator